MDFRFTEEQLAFRDSLRKLLLEECTTESIRKLWKSENGFNQDRWDKLSNLGVVGSIIDEDDGGLSLSDIDLVLMAEEVGYSALPEPLLEVGWVTASLLNRLPNHNHENWKPKLANGDLIALTCHEINEFIPNANLAEFFFLQHGDGLYYASKADVKLIPRQGLDPSIRIFTIDWNPKRTKRLMHRSESVDLWQEVLNRGVLLVSAQLIGLTQRLLDMSVDYVKTRQQFGKPIGSFQAIKHLLADIQIQLDFARPVVYKAAHSLASKGPGRYRDVSYAKLASSKVSKLAARSSIQAHGAIGYTWEADLQIFMKRIWFLDIFWGSHSWHLNRLEKELLSPSSKIGPGVSFV